MKRLLFLLLLVVIPAKANELPDAPVAKPAAHSRWDKGVTLLASIHAGTAAWDIVSTESALRRCTTCVETDPYVRAFNGSRPGAARLAAFEAVEVVGAAFLAEKMRHSRRFHKFWWIPQVVAIGAHTEGAIHNA